MDSGGELKMSSLQATTAGCRLSGFDVMPAIGLATFGLCDPYPKLGVLFSISCSVSTISGVVGQGLLELCA